MIFFALFALAAPECLKWAKSDHSEKTIEVDCDSSTFNFIQKCYNVWDNVEDGNVDFFWTPLGSRKVDERQLIEKDGQIYEELENGQQSKNEHFSLKTDKLTGPHIEDFKKVHEGQYRCQGRSFCNGTDSVENYIIKVHLNKQQTSAPKAYLTCASGCIDERGTKIDKTYIARQDSSISVHVDVIYPPCGLIEPKWFKNGKEISTGENLDIRAETIQESDKYSALLVGAHGSVNLPFQLQVTETEDSKIEILAAIGIAVFLVILMSVAVLALKKYKSDEKPGLRNINGPENLPMLVSEDNPLQELSYAEQFNNLIPQNLHADVSDLGGSRHWIGSGHFGEVYLCTVEARKFPLLHSNYDEKRRVAVKTWKVDSTDANFYHEFQNIVDELNIMIAVEKSRMNFDRALSQYVIQLIGCGMTPGETHDDGVRIKNQPAPFLVLEYADNGDLLKFLRDHKQRGREKQANAVGTPYAGLSYADLNKFAYQIACGMVFLSENNIVHRDLAARNILVSSDYTMKISDFGLSKEKEYYVAHRGNKLPWKWMAIESIQDHRSSVYTDVWSFGVTMWEIFSLGNQPYPTRTPEDVRNFLEAGNRLDRPQYASRQIYQIMKDCWKPDPHERPKFRDLADDLEKELETCDRELKLDMRSTGNDSDSGLGDGQVTPDTAPPVPNRPGPVPPPVSPRTDI